MLHPAAPIHNDDRASLLALLRSISEELHLIACEVVQLGEALSGEVEASRPDRHMRELQSFDMIGQHVIAQARLLRGRAPSFGTCERQRRGHAQPDPGRAVPPCAQRLFAAFDGSGDAGAAAQNKTDDTDWFA